VIFVLVNIDSAVVGKMLDVKMLGYYAMASSIANLPATNITHILGRILFPTYSVLQDDKKRFGEVFLKIVEYISFLTIPASFALFIFAPELVTYVIGKRWMPIIPALRILCVGALLRSITATTGDVFKAIGRPKLLQDISLVQLILMVVLIVPAIHYGGIIGVSVLVTLKSFLAFTLSMYVVAVNVRLSVKDIYNPMRTQFFSSIISAAVVFFVGRILPPTMPSLILSISLFGLLYILLFCLINRKIFYEFRELLKCILPNPRLYSRLTRISSRITQ